MMQLTTYIKQFLNLFCDGLCKARRAWIANKKEAVRKRCLELGLNQEQFGRQIADSLGFEEDI